MALTLKDLREKVRSIADGSGVVELPSGECGVTAKQLAIVEDFPPINFGLHPRYLPPKPAPERCACGQTVWDGQLDYSGQPICSDCISDTAAACWGSGPKGDIDARIRAAKTEPERGDVGPWDERDTEYEL